MFSAFMKYMKRMGWKEIIMMGVSTALGIPFVTSLIYGGTALLLSTM